jgi:hypothetical protein
VKRALSILSAPFVLLCVWCLLVLFLCTACNDHHSGHARTCNTPEQREALACDRVLENPLGGHAALCDLPDCEEVKPPEPCEEHGGHNDCN